MVEARGPVGLSAGQWSAWKRAGLGVVVPRCEEVEGAVPERECSEVGSPVVVSPFSVAPGQVKREVVLQMEKASGQVRSVVVKYPARDGVLARAEKPRAGVLFFRRILEEWAERGRKVEELENRLRWSHQREEGLQAEVENLKGKMEPMARSLESATWDARLAQEKYVDVREHRGELMQMMVRYRSYALAFFGEDKPDLGDLVAVWIRAEWSPEEERPTADLAGDFNVWVSRCPLPIPRGDKVTPSVMGTVLRELQDRGVDGLVRRRVKRGTVWMIKVLDSAF